MRNLRKCNTGHLNTGISKCPVDFARMKGAIIVPYGSKLPANLSVEALTKQAHADEAERIYGIVGFCEFAQEGGEAQTGAVGYGGLQVTGYSDRADTYTLDKNYPELHASLTKCAGYKFGAYYFDEKNMLYGLNDGTDELAPFPMNTIHSNATPYSTSGSKSTMTVKFCHENSRAAIENADYIQLDFNPMRATLGLTGVKLIKVGDTGNDYKLIEAVGGYDLTSIFGPLMADNTNVISGATAVAYDTDKEVLTLTVSGSATPALKSPKLLLEAGIAGIEQV